MSYPIRFLKVLNSTRFLLRAAWAVLIAGVLAAGILSEASAQTATITYQGFGANTPGGYGKTVYRVTNLKDTGPGSLRDALSRGNRHIVFDVAGTIHVQNKRIDVMGSFITVDGFSAPSPGITLQGGGIRIRGTNGAHDVVIQGIRIRDAAAAPAVDCVTIFESAYNIVIDHVSVSGCADGAIDITENSHDVTVSWSILGPTQGGKAMLIRYNPSAVTLHHNLFVNNPSRNPDVSGQSGLGPGTTLDMRNNVVWNWGGGRGTLIKYGARVNVVNNYYANPTGSDNDKKQAIIACRYDGSEPPEVLSSCPKGSGASTKAYVAGNISGDALRGYDPNVANNVSNPHPAPQVTTEPTCVAAQKVIAAAGVQPLDLIDRQFLSGIALPACYALAPPAPQPNSPPVADAGPDQGTTVGTAIVFDGSKSRDPDGNSMTYRWDFGDGATAGGVTTTHAYGAAGIYTVTLTVSDGMLSASDTAKVTVAAVVKANSPPVANAGPDQSTTVGTALMFDGSGSKDPDGDPLTYLWDFGDGATASGVTASHAYAAAGLYTVLLTVSDGILSASDIAQVTITASSEKISSGVHDPGFPYFDVDNDQVFVDAQAGGADIAVPGGCPAVIAELINAHLFDAQASGAPLKSGLVLPPSCSPDLPEKSRMSATLRADGLVTVTSQSFAVNRGGEHLQIESRNSSAGIRLAAPNLPASTKVHGSLSANGPINLKTAGSLINGGIAGMPDANSPARPMILVRRDSAGCTMEASGLVDVTDTDVDCGRWLKIASVGGGITATGSSLTTRSGGKIVLETPTAGNTIDLTNAIVNSSDSILLDNPGGVCILTGATMNAPQGVSLNCGVVIP